MEIRIPINEGVTAKKEGKELIFSKDGKINRREVFHPLIDVVIEKDNIVLKSKVENRRLKKIIKSLESHIINLIQGLINPFIYKLKIAGSHFPITVKLEGKNIIISNYLGEKVPRKCRIVGDSAVKIEGDIIIVESVNKEHAGMTAGIIEKTAQIKIHDRRTFQDGIYIIEKAGKIL